jgi:hypothetical protein
VDQSEFDRLTRLFGMTKSRRGWLRAAFGVLASGTLLATLPGTLAVAGERRRQRRKARDQERENDQTGTREQDRRRSASGQLASDVVAAGELPYGATCTRDAQCQSQHCLGNGTCGCSATVDCTQPSNRCKKAVCRLSTHRCVIKVKTPGTECRDDGLPCIRHTCNELGQCVRRRLHGVSCPGGCCENGVCRSKAELCARADATCGTIVSSCGKTFGCGACSNPRPICVDNVCRSCTRARPCPDGQICCDGSCFEGVCCADAECEPGGNTCNESHECRCGSAGACSAAEPTCCDPDVNNTCANLATDPDNCGDCRKACDPGTPDCCDGECVSTTWDLDHCGGCGKTCIGDNCDQGTCWCGTPGATGSVEGGCDPGFVCESGNCVSCGDAVCGGSCQPCPNPPGMVQMSLVPDKGFCCNDQNPGGDYCSCGGKCCGSEGDCFIEGTPLNPQREFCCSDEGGQVCDINGTFVCCKKANCDECIHQSGRIGSYRRPR